MGKWLSGIAIVLLLVVVPFGSWYYLKRGLTYRKNALQEVLVKDSISGMLDSLRLLQGKTTILVLTRDTAAHTVVSAILKQYEKVPFFQVIFRDTLEGDNTSKVLPKGYIQQATDKVKGYSYLLLDTGLYVRNVYKSNKADIKKMVEHIAIVLPRQKDPDIKMK